MKTTLVGNYPKVAEGAYSTKLIGTITRWQRQEVDDAQLEATCREITEAVIKEQEDAGLDLVTDGQIRWEDLVTPFARGLDGVEINGLSRWFNNNVYYRRPIFHKAPARRKPILIEQYKFAARTSARPVKAVLPGPYTLAIVSEDRHYKKQRPFVMKLAELLNAEACDLARAGAPLIQFDEPAVGFGLPAPRGARQAGKTDIKLAIEALNTATAGLKTKTGVTTYFGSLDGTLAPLMKARVDVIGVDVVSDPATLRALKRVKITKELALGCMDARNTKLESVKELHAIWKAVGRLVPQDRLYVNPNTGLEFLPHAQALAKVRRLVQAAKAYRGGR